MALAYLQGSAKTYLQASGRCEESLDSAIVQRRCPRRSIPSIERNCRAIHARGLFMAGSFPAIELGGLLAPDSQAEVWGGSGRCA